ncbi:hypothetical protein JCM10207_009256 [Rhodosporidiobolus poonsookiae]
MEKGKRTCGHAPPVRSAAARRQLERSARALDLLSFVVVFFRTLRYTTSSPGEPEIPYTMATPPCLNLDAIRLILAEIHSPSERRSVGKSVSLVCRALRDDGQRMVWNSLASYLLTDWPWENEAVNLTLRDDRLAGFVGELYWGVAWRKSYEDADLDRLWTLLSQVLRRCGRLRDLHISDIPLEAHSTIFRAVLASPACPNIEYLALSERRLPPGSADIAYTAANPHPVELLQLLCALGNLRTFDCDIRFRTPASVDYAPPAMGTLSSLRTLSVFQPRFDNPAPYFPDDDPFLRLLLPRLDRHSLRDLTIPHFPHQTLLLSFLPGLALTSLDISGYNNLPPHFASVVGPDYPPFYLLDDLAPVLPSLSSLEFLALRLPVPYFNPTDTAEGSHSLTSFLNTLPSTLESLSIDIIFTPSNPLFVDYLAHPRSAALRRLIFVTSRNGPISERSKTWEKSKQGEWQVALKPSS